MVMTEMLVLFMLSSILVLWVIVIIMWKSLSLITDILSMHEDTIEKLHENGKRYKRRIDELESAFNNHKIYSSVLAQNTVPPYLSTDLLKREISRREFRGK